MTGITPRQLEILRLLGRGYNTAEIAERQVVEVKTVEAQMLRMRQRWGVKNIHQLRRIAIKRYIEEEIERRLQERTQE